MGKSKKVIVDIKGSLLYLQRRGIKETKVSIANQVGISPQLVNAYDGSSYYIVYVAYRIVKKAGISFPELMSMIKHKEAPGILNFILQYCKITGLTFEEVVKEISV